MNHFDDLFLQAREISDLDARAAFLDHACAHQPELRARLDALLADASAADAFFGEDDTAVGVLARARDLGAAEEASDRALASVPPLIGPYRILERIGHGGMGDVFRAVQKEPIRREVALKLIKLGMDTQQVIARFEAERQALALMDHPHIARVLDAGADDQGHPFFVMELVRGVPITQYADDKQLTLRERLALMQQVCQAIQHAHSKGVIHRDLKPSNILVSTQDGSPHAKVIDFGIAKATAQPLTDKTLFTQFQQFIGTPQYMSPEQAEGSLDIDTRSDVYALGVLLYELLTGGTPVEAATLRQAALHEIARIIKEQDTPKPSTRLLNVGVLTRARGSRSESTPDPRVLANAPTTPTTLADLAKARSISAESLIKTVRGELDWLVMKALEKDRTRRYETPNQLSDDIARYLEGQPIVAAPPSRSYRMQKFIRKHRAPVLAAAAVLTLMTAGILGTSWGLVREKAAKEEATQQAKIAEQERTRAEAEKAEAQKQKTEADQQRLTAETAKTTAEREREAAELESYIGNLAAAQAALTAHDYPGARARLAVCPEKLRGWEWRFLNEKAKALLCVLDRSIQPLKFTPDGVHIIAYSSAKRALRLYDMEGKSSSPLFAIPDVFLDSSCPNPDQIQFSKDGSVMLYVCEDSHENGIIIFETSTGKRLLSMPSNPPNGWPARPQLSSDGQMFALSNTAQIGRVDGSLVSLSVQKGRDESCLFVDEDFTSVVVVTNNTAQLMNLAGHFISEQIVLDKQILRAEFSRDGTRFLLHATSQTHLFNCFGHQIGAPIPSSMFIDRIGFSPDGKYLVVAQKDKLVLLHSDDGLAACTLKLPHSLHDSHCNAIDWNFSENGAVLVANLSVHGENRLIQAWELPSGKSILTKMPARNYLDAVVSPTGSHFITYSAYEGRDLRLPRRFELEYKYFNPLLEPYRWDNDAILATDEYRSKIRRELNGPGGLCLWNSEGYLLASIDSWHDKYSIESYGEFIQSEDGKHIIAKSENGCPVFGFQSFGSPVWKIRDRSRKEILDAWIEVPNDSPATSGSNDVYLETCIEAACQQDRLLQEGDSLKLATQEASDSMVIRAKALMDNLKNHDAIYYVSVSNDGQRIYAATDRQLIVWSVAAGREIARFHTDIRVQHIAMSGDDSRMILCFVDGSAQIWDSRHYTQRQRFYKVLSAEQAECERIFEKIWDPTAPMTHLRDLIESDKHLTKLKKLLVVSLLESAHERKTREANFKLKESK